MDEETSAYAEEGTKAHALAEAKLRLRMARILPEDVEEVRKGCDPEMDIMTDRYVEYAQDIVDQLRLAGLVPYWEIETRVSFDRWVPEGFGTLDLFIVGGEHLHIIDLKYGKGVPISAIGNSQLRTYCLGFLQDYGLIYDNIKTVTYHIAQPRLNNYTSETMTVEELMRWAKEELQPRAMKAWNGIREFNPGEHCKFCRAKAVCKARASRILDTITSVLWPGKLKKTTEGTMEEFKELKDPDLLTKEEIERLLPILDDLQDWAAKVQAYALEQALAGIKYDGYKVVEGRAYRKVTNEEGLVKAFEKQGYDASLCYERKLLSVSRLEAIAGKKLFAEISAPYVDKPKSKPTLVPESDKRDPITIAADDFNDDFRF